MFIFEDMQAVDVLKSIVTEQEHIVSSFLGRTMTIDFYLPKDVQDLSKLSLLLINDGQDLKEMKFASILDNLLFSRQIQPVLCVGIHAGADRRNEYGTAKILDYAGRGAKAARYNQFILGELLPYIHGKYCIEAFHQKAFAGFSLGGLTAIDMTWHYPEIFSIAGVFSGSLWWRCKALEDGYNEATDRIMHQQIRNGIYRPGLRFFFTTGSLDETADRNHNGIIDSIDDTLGLIAELEHKGYNTTHDMRYINFEDGKHDIATWGKGMTYFLLWGWSTQGK